MSRLPALRRDLDVMPSPVREQPGILIRDPMRYSQAVLLIPWALGPALHCFDGKQSDLDLRAALMRATGELDVGALADQLIAALRESAFLLDEAFDETKRARQRRFAEAAVREPSHVGSAYPADAEELTQTMSGYIDVADRDGRKPAVMGIASPHVSPFGGWQSYRAAYRTLPRAADGKTFVILGTSHYGVPDRFGMTRKAFETPLGRAETDVDLVNRLVQRAPGAVVEEDYCHAVEHSIEFQVLFLQWLYGPNVRVLPILCGSFARSIYDGGKPEKNGEVARFLGELGELGEQERDRLIWVLGIDMAHIGRRYGDKDPAHAYSGYLSEVAERDGDRNACVTAGDADGFWERIQENRDALRWCGSSPLYTFLKAVPGVRGTVERYEQWNIDEASVVSFAGISFTRGD